MNITINQNLKGLGIELHHFHNSDADIVMPGSLSKESFRLLIENLLTAGYQINNPDIWIKKSELGDFNKRDVCLTFDDNISSQYLVAKDVL